MVLPPSVARRGGLSLDHPAGRVPHPDHHRIAQLHATEHGWRLDGTGWRSHRGTWSDLDATLDQFDDVHEVRLRVPPGLNIDLSTWIRRVASRGTFVVGDPQVTPGAHSEILGAKPGDLAWDVASVAQRRDALLFATEHLDQRPLPGLSVVLVTRRPAFMPRIIAMLESQTHPNFEVVLVNHGGEALSINTTLQLTSLGTSPSVSLGAALTLATAAAASSLITKVDDDDYYGPDHLVDLALAHRYSGATLIGKSSTVVYLEDMNTTVRRVFMAPEEFTHRVAGGTLLIAAEDLAQVGGWSDVPRGVDSQLIERVTAADGLIYRPHDIGYLYVRHGHGAGVAHTWDTDHRHFLRNAREQWFGLLRSTAYGTG